MLKVFLNIYCLLFFFLFTLFGLVLLPFILFVNVLFFSRGIGSTLRRAIRLYGRVLVCEGLFFAPVKVEYRTKKLTPSSIYVANHTSAIDPYLFGAVAADENSFVTSWPFKIPLYGRFMRLAGYANADDGWDSVREKCTDLLNNGCSVTIWPEGHRSRDGRLGRFRKGAFVLAVETGRPVVPVCIFGAAKVLPPGRRFLNPGRIKLIVLAPVYPSTEGEQYERVKALNEKVRQEIEKTLMGQS